MTDYLGTYRTYRVTLTVAGTEYSQALTGRATKVTISADDLSSTIFISFTALASGTGKRIFPGAEWFSPGFIRGSKTVYLQSPNAGTVAVIEEWEAP
jgi:hypothetical protein